MRIALRVPRGRTGPPLRALAQLLHRTQVAPASFVAKGNSADVEICWGSSNTSETIPFLRVPLEKRLLTDRYAWRESAAAFLAAWRRRKAPDTPSSSLFEYVSKGSSARFDLFSVCLGLLEQWDEELGQTADEHGRFAPAESLIARHELLEVPIVDLVAISLREELERLTGMKHVGAEVLGGKRWAFCPTFDIDSDGMFRGPRAYHMGFQALRAGLVTSAKFAVEGVLSTARLKPDPHVDIMQLCQQIEGTGARATFFVQTHRAHRLDNYILSPHSPLVRPLRRAIAERHEVGLHSSYGTMANAVSYDAQWSRLRRILRGARPVHRAHYLRAGLADSWRDQRVIDSSIAFGAVTGWRLGTSVPHPTAGRAWEVPPAAMDVTFRYREGLHADGATERALTLMHRARASGGVFTYVAHPQNLEDMLWPGWRAGLFDLFAEARRKGAYIAPLGRVARHWRTHYKNCAAAINAALPT